MSCSMRIAAWTSELWPCIIAATKPSHDLRSEIISSRRLEAFGPKFFSCHSLAWIFICIMSGCRWQHNKICRGEGGAGLGLGDKTGREACAAREEEEGPATVWATHSLNGCAPDNTRTPCGSLSSSSSRFSSPAQMQP